MFTRIKAHGKNGGKAQENQRPLKDQQNKTYLDKQIDRRIYLISWGNGKHIEHKCIICTSCSSTGSYSIPLTLSYFKWQYSIMILHNTVHTITCIYT